MSKIDEYRSTLQHTQDWDAYLLAHSGLPGPRANLELLYTAAGLADEPRLLAWCAIPAEQAPGNAPPVFLVCCGIVGLGKLINAGQEELFQRLRQFACDQRWRVREAVAMALQITGDANMSRLLAEMRRWKTGSSLEQRAVVAGLCEPRLLMDPAATEQVLDILDEITTSFAQTQDRKNDAFVVLKKGLSYGWSVAVAACPDTGKPRIEQWLTSPDKDVRAVMKENLLKNRLIRMDATWVTAQQNRLGGGLKNARQK